MEDSRKTDRQGKCRSTSPTFGKSRFTKELHLFSKKVKNFTRRSEHVHRASLCLTTSPLRFGVAFVWQ